MAEALHALGYPILKEQVLSQPSHHATASGMNDPSARPRCCRPAWRGCAPPVDVRVHQRAIWGDAHVHHTARQSGQVSGVRLVESFRGAWEDLGGGVTVVVLAWASGRWPSLMDQAVHISHSHSDPGLPLGEGSADELIRSSESSLSMEAQSRPLGSRIWEAPSGEAGPLIRASSEEAFGREGV